MQCRPECGACNPVTKVEQAAETMQSSCMLIGDGRQFGHGRCPGAGRHRPEMSAACSRGNCAAGRNGSATPGRVFRAEQGGSGQKALPGACGALQRLAQGLQRKGRLGQRQPGSSLTGSRAHWHRKAGVGGGAGPVQPGGPCLAAKPVVRVSAAGAFPMQRAAGR